VCQKDWLLIEGLIPLDVGVDKDFYERNAPRWVNLKELLNKILVFWTTLRAILDVPFKDLLLDLDWVLSSEGRITMI